jgi:deoxyribonuclease-4
MLRIGYHVSISGRIDLAFDRAREIGCAAMQVFLSNPRGWGIKILTNDEIAAFRSKSISFGVSAVLAHMTYLPNLASPNEFAYKKSLEALDFALDRCRTLGIRHLVTHLGSHLGKGREAGFARIISALRSSAGGAKGVSILLENEAGQRNSIGSHIEDLSELRARIVDEAPELDVGFCIDTCHLFEAGYDVRRNDVIGGVFDALGRRNIKAIHLNDARYDLGRGLDRHENIGEGYIGRKGFAEFLSFEFVRKLPIIMETPVRGPEIDRQQMALVERLAR